MKNKADNVCDNCKQKGDLLGILVHSMQMKDGKAVAYKTTYFGKKEIGCKPCKEYVEKELEVGAVECDYSLKK